MRPSELPENQRNTLVDCSSFQNKMVAKIAANYAKNQSELEALYLIGLNGYNKAKNRLINSKKFETMTVWWVEQEILTHLKHESDQNPTSNLDL